MASPIPGCPVSTPYGKRGSYWSCNEDSNGNGVHTGVDFAASSGTDVFAPIDGQIRHRSYGSAFGNHQFAISPDPGEPFGDGEVFFAHMTSRPADGVYVKVGDYLGNVGAEGNASGPHLHMEYHATSKNSWSCSVHDDPQPILDWSTAPPNPPNPNGVAVGDMCYAVANGGLKLRESPGGQYTGGWLSYGDLVLPIEIVDGWALDDLQEAWCSVEYLYPVMDPRPNPNGILPGDRVRVTANDLIARTLPGGPERLTDDGEILTRPKGYEFDALDVWDGWAWGGTNYYAADYLDRVTEPAGAPGWDPIPYRVLSMDDVPGSVSYLQGVMRVPGMTDNDGQTHNPYWIVAQDYNNEGNIRFLCFRDDGTLANHMTVNDAGHGQTFYAYRSAAGNLYVWCGENPAYRYAWQPGETVSRSSGDKMDFKGGRPMGGYPDRVCFRDATDTKETFYLFDRTDFTGGDNRTNPLRSCTLSKRTDKTQQSWAASDDRIYRIYGSTNEDTEHEHDDRHIVDVYTWDGDCLVDGMDITDMFQPGASESEPEGICFTASPGEVLAGIREGSASASEREYVLWRMVNLP